MRLPGAAAVLLGLLLAACSPGAPPGGGPPGSPAASAPAESVGSGPLFRRPWSLTLAPDGAVVATDSAGSSVYRVDPSTGDRTRAFPPSPGESRDTTPEGALLEEDGSLLVVDRDRAEVGWLLRGRSRVLSAAGKRGRGPALVAPTRLQRLPDGHLAVLDPGARALVEIDPASGDRQVMSGPGRGKGPPFDEPDDLVVLPDGRLFVADNFTGRVTRVDRGSGDRTLAVDVRRPPGPTITRPFGLGPGGPDELLVCDPIIGTVLAVELGSGQRQVISSPRVGSGASCYQVFDALRLPDGTVALSNPRGRALVRVDARGHRSTLSGQATPEAPLEAVDNCVAAAGSRVVVADALGGRLLQVDPDTGAFKELSGPARGAGPAFRCPNEIALAGDRAFLVDWAAGLLEVDLASGDRQAVVPGDHPSLRQLFDVAMDRQGRVWLLDTRVPAVFRLDGRELLLASGPGRGRGPAFRYPGRVVASSRGTLLVTDMDEACLLEVDPSTGDRTILSGPSRGRGEPFAMPEAVVELPSGEILVSDVDRGRILAVAPTGDRRVLAGPDTGTGPPLDAPEDMALLPDGRVLVSDPGYGGLIGLDPGTGNRTLLHLMSR